MRIYITREIPAFAGISFALRWSGAFGATFGVPAAPIWNTAAFGAGEREKKNNNNIWGAGASAYATFGGDKNILINIKKFGAPAVP